MNSLYWEIECLRLHLTKMVLLDKMSKKDNAPLQHLFNHIPRLKYRYHGSFPFDFAPTFDKEAFAIISTQPSNMQYDHWILIANSRQILLFADSLGRKMYSFLKHRYEQMVA